MLPCCQFCHSVSCISPFCLLKCVLLFPYSVSQTATHHIQGNSQDHRTCLAPRQGHAGKGFIDLAGSLPRASRSFGRDESRMWKSCPGMDLYDVPSTTWVSRGKEHCGTLELPSHEIMPKHPIFEGDFRLSQWEQSILLQKVTPADRGRWSSTRTRVESLLGRKTCWKPTAHLRGYHQGSRCSPAS